MSEPRVVAIETPGLGNQTYLVGSGSEAVAVDVPRDGWRIADVAQDHGWRITHALETHVHNDYLSGARELREAHGTAILAPGRGGYAFGFQPADEGFELPLDGGGLVARATPGHTPEHLAWELQDEAGYRPASESPRTRTARFCFFCACRRIPRPAFPKGPHPHCPSRHRQTHKRGPSRRIPAADLRAISGADSPAGRIHPAVFPNPFYGWLYARL